MHATMSAVKPAPIAGVFADLHLSLVSRQLEQFQRSVCAGSDVPGACRYHRPAPHPKGLLVSVLPSRQRDCRYHHSRGAQDRSRSSTVEQACDKLVGGNGSWDGPGQSGSVLALPDASSDELLAILHLHLLGDCSRSSPSTFSDADVDPVKCFVLLRAPL